MEAPRPAKHLLIELLSLQCFNSSDHLRTQPIKLFGGIFLGSRFTVFIVARVQVHEVLVQILCHLKLAARDVVLALTLLSSVKRFTVLLTIHSHLKLLEYGRVYFEDFIAVKVERLQRLSRHMMQLRQLVATARFNCRQWLGHNRGKFIGV